MDENANRLERDDLAVLPVTSPKQAFLFDCIDVGCELLTIEQDKASNKHTGTTLARRQELYDAVCMRLAAGVSLREVARIFGIGRNTVTAIRTRLEESGKMEPYKKRVATKLGQIAEMGIELLGERMERGEIPTNVIPIAVGIALEKKAMIEGEPTLILGRVAQPELSQEGYDRWLEGLKVAKGVTDAAPADSQSTEGGSNGQ